MSHQVTWLDAPEEHDFPAAAAYLSLLLPDAEVERLITALRAAEARSYKAKDILRAARLRLLTPDNPHVASDLAKVAKGRSLSPVLLVAGDLRLDRPLQVADGYHRVCASYHLDENTDIPCRVAVASA